MPTLNLGRVRFNWKGDYDPNASYLEYDVVKDDGQSYVAIQNVTDTDPGPNETGGDAFWEGVLLRGDDYNAARDEAVQAASDAEASATTASGHAGAAGTSATEAAGSEEMAERWGNEAEDVEVAPGLYSAYHWSQKAAQAGDPDQFDITADQTSDTRTTSQWMAAVLANQQKANDNETAIGERAKLSGGADANFTAMPQVGGDPIVESGSNSDGEWTRWADGTQWCGIRRLSGTFSSTTNEARRAITWTFPSSFSNDPVIGIGGYLADDMGGTNRGIVTSRLAELQVDPKLKVQYDVNSFNGQAISRVVDLSTSAYGRWK